MQVEDQAPRAVYVRLRQRARALRGLAIGFVALIALTLAFGTIPYFLAGSMAVTESRAALEMRRFEAEQNAKGVEKREGVEKRNRVAGETASADDAVGAGPTTAATGGAGGAPAHAEVRAPAAAPTPGTGQIPGLGVGDEVFSAAVIRVTAVLLLVALVYLFGSLYRYSMRLASYYDEKADALRLLEAGDLQLEERLSQITEPGTTGARRPVRSRERV
jgi:hypothetical protein